MVKRKVTDDMVLVLSGLIVGVLFLWTQQNSLYTAFDFYIYIITFIGIIGGPMFYSSVVHWREKHAHS